MKAAALIDDGDEMVVFRFSELAEAAKDDGGIAREDQVARLEAFGELLRGADFLVGGTGVGRASCYVKNRVGREDLRCVVEQRAGVSLHG